jgi:hypothetical protein
MVQIEPPPWMGDRASSPAGWRRPPRRWICVVLHGSTTGRPLLQGSTAGKGTMATAEVGKGSLGGGGMSGSSSAGVDGGRRSGEGMRLPTVAERQPWHLVVGRRSYGGR